MSELADYPEARPAALPRRGLWWWLLPVAALLIAGWLVLSHLGARGPQIQVAFPLGHGLKTGDALRHRGIQVGQVSRVALDPTMRGVQVSIQLQPDTAALARQGSRFWIVRPRLDLSGATGLETVVGARYLAVMPGDGPPSRDFQGLEEAPRITDPDALQIILSAPGRGNLRVGAPVSYRQVAVGSVESVALAADASHVQARVAIRPGYVGLIRDNTRFWRTSGARVGADLGGLYLDVESVQGLILGGISLAVAPQPGPLARPGQRFPLAQEADPEWLAWAPSLQPAGPTALAPRPTLIPLTRRWQQDNALGLSRQHQRQGWALALPGGLLAPADLLAPPGPTAEDTRLLSGDTPLALDAAQPLNDQLGWLAMRHAWPAWPTERIRALSFPEDLLLLADPDQPPRFVAAYRLQIDAPGWRLDPDLSLEDDWRGAAVLAASDGLLVGILAGDPNHQRVLPIPRLP